MSKHKPATRQEFADFCLRKLGSPVIQVNVSEDQVQDQIESALKYYADYHFDGSEKIYIKYPLTNTDINNGYIPIADNVIGIVRIFDTQSLYSSSGMFSYEYQYALNNMWDMSQSSIVPYYMAMQQESLIRQVLQGTKPLRYNRHGNKLYIDGNSLPGENQFIVIEAYVAIDPEVNTDVWNDRWLQRYTTALIKQIWGMNLSKFDGVTLPGGVTFNGTKILDDAVDEISQLESEMISTYSLPVSDMIG